MSTINEERPQQTKSTHSKSRTDEARVQTRAMQPYVDAGCFTLLPLHRYTDKTKRHGRVMLDGKRPIHNDWTKRKYQSKRTVEIAAEENRNVGVRLKPDQLVLDIDPRNGGEDGFASLCADLGLDSSAWPHVITGSGGSHYYMGKPADVLVVDTLEAYPGVEFKSAGRQVVAAGSIHPETKRHYKWDADAPSLVDGEVLVSRKLLRLITRPVHVATGEGAGKYTPEQLQNALDVIDPIPFNTNDKWSPMLMACHHATAGEGRTEFIAWSTSDPRYKNDADIIGRRWDSLHKEKPDGYTSRTLEYHIRKAGRPDLQVAGDAASDFEDDIEEEFSFEPDPIPPIKYDITKLSEMLDYAEAAMMRADVQLYQMGGRLVHPVRVDTDSSDADDVRRKAGSLTVREVNALRLREYMIEHAPFYVVKVDKQGERKRIRTAAPMALANHYLARGDRWCTPVLNGVIETPTLRRDGTLLEDDGYDAASGLLLAKGGVEFPSVKDAPTFDDAREALEQLKEPFKDFPFVANAKGESPSRSVMLSAVLTGVVRRTLHSAPIHGTSAPTMGTGKTLAMDVVSLIVTGRLTTAMSQGANEEEDEKRLFSVLLQNDQILLIDNVKRPIEGDALCTILTQSTWQSRILGENRKVAVPTNALFLASGNNLTFKGDMVTRALLCRMDARVERPETRRFTVDLKAEIPKRRPELVAAVLTVLRAFVVAGRPGLEQLTPFGRFEDWSNLVRGALVWLGEPDPCRTRNFIAVDDPERNDLEQLLIAMHDHAGDRPCAAKELIEMCDCSDTSLLDAIESAVPKATAKTLGSYLKQREGKIVGGLHLRGVFDKHRKLWTYRAKKA